MIKTTMIGHLGKDAIIKEFNGKTVINFSVAHTESFKNAEGTKTEKTIWAACAYWSEKVSIAQYLKKGTQVYVEGIPSIDTYTDRDGRAIANFKLRVHQIQLLGSAKPQEQTTQEAAQALVKGETVTDFVEEKDDLPF